MKKIYVAPQTEIVVMASVCTICAASGNAVADLDNGNNGGFTDHEIDVDNGDDESDAKGNGFDFWEE